MHNTKLYLFRAHTIAERGDNNISATEYENYHGEGVS